MIYERYTIVYLKTTRCNGTDFTTEEPQVRQARESLKHSWLESVTRNILQIIAKMKMVTNPSVLLQCTFPMYRRRVHGRRK